MLIVPEYAFCFVCIPKTGSQAMSRYLESKLRNDDSTTFWVESLHDWHASVEEVEQVGELPFSLYDVWSFAVVRNPFDRLVSYCAMSDDFQVAPRNVIRAKLQSAIDGDDDRWMLPQSYFARGVKKLYRFEQLPQAVEELKDRFGIADNDPFPHINKSLRDRYAAYFDGELKAMVEEYYAEDLAAFGYKF